MQKKAFEIRFCHNDTIYSLYECMHSSLRYTFCKRNAMMLTYLSDYDLINSSWHVSLFAYTTVFTIALT